MGTLTDGVKAEDCLKILLLEAPQIMPIGMVARLQDIARLCKDPTRSQRYVQDSL